MPKSFRNIFFVGYYLNDENKLANTELYRCKNRFFLESSRKYLKKKYDHVRYFPMHLYHMLGTHVITLLFNRVKVDQCFISLYKRDLKIFLKSQIDLPLPKSKKSYLLYIYSVFRNEYKFRSIFSLKALLILVLKIMKPEELLLERSHLDKIINNKDAKNVKSFRHIRAIKVLAFRLSFITGYIYVEKLLSKLNPGSDDIFVLWGCETSGSMLLIDRLKKAGIHYFISEYGELPGTISINSKGIFGDSYIADNWAELVEAEVDDNELEDITSYISLLESSQASSRGGSSEQLRLQLRLYQSLNTLLKPEQKKEREKIIYVSGVELIASGHLFNKEYINSKSINANEILLKSVLFHFSSDNYIIIYKDHPLMQKNYQNLALVPSEFPGVIFLNSQSVDDLIPMSDITITLPSKVAMTCLLYRKPVYVFGRFSIPYSMPELGYYTGNNVGEVKGIIDNTNIDKAMYTKIVAHLISNYLLCYDSLLFENYCFETEQRKLDKIIHDQMQCKIEV